MLGFLQKEHVRVWYFSLDMFSTSTPSFSPETFIFLVLGSMWVASGEFRFQDLPGLRIIEPLSTKYKMYKHTAVAQKSGTHCWAPLGWEKNRNNTW